MSPSFRFQTLLDYRNRIVEDRQIDLANRQREFAEAKLHLSELYHSRTRMAEYLQRGLAGVLRIDEIQQQYRYLNALDGKISQQQAVLQSAEEATETARAALEAALKERKTMEKLKEYDADDFREDMRQREAKALDDLNIARYSRSG